MPNPLLSAFEMLLALAAAGWERLTPLTSIEFDEAEPTVGYGQLPGFTVVEEPKTRLCCAIGWQPSQAIFPALTATKPMGVGKLGAATHEYGGPTIAGPSSLFGDRPISHDPVGHLYTGRGGIIDIGHVRDHADLARYCAIQVRSLLPSGGQFSLRDEAGARSVTIDPSAVPNFPGICAILGARISYDIAIWHEIVTWASTAVGAKQEYSAFSPEDNYSNLLGAYLGYRALHSQQPFNDALSEQLLLTMVRLGAVSNLVTEETIAYTVDRWYAYDSSNNLELYRRHFDALGTVTPWLITDVEIPGRESQLASVRGKVGHPIQPTAIHIPSSHPVAGDLDDLYTLAIDVSGSIRSEITNGQPIITNADFPAIIDRIKAEVLARYPNGDEM